MSLAQGIYNSTPPTLPNAGSAPLQLDANGRLLTTASGGTGTSSNQVQGTAANNATAVGNPIDVAVEYLTTAPTLTNGQHTRLQGDVNGNAKVREQYAPLYEDNVAGVAKVEQRFAPTYISTATTTTVKSGSGHLHTLVIGETAAGTITIYDNTAASGTIIAVLKASIVEGTYQFNCSFTTGLTIVTAAASKLTVSYR